MFLLLGGVMALLGLYHVRALPATPRDNTGAARDVRAIGATLADVLKTFFARPGIWVAILFMVIMGVAAAGIIGAYVQFHLEHAVKSLQLVERD